MSLADKLSKTRTFPVSFRTNMDELKKLDDGKQIIIVIDKEDYILKKKKV